MYGCAWVQKAGFRSVWYGFVRLGWVSARGFSIVCWWHSVAEQKINVAGNNSIGRTHRTGTSCQDCHLDASGMFFAHKPTCFLVFLPGTALPALPYEQFKFISANIVKA